MSLASAERSSGEELSAEPGGWWREWPSAGQKGHSFATLASAVAGRKLGIESLAGERAFTDGAAVFASTDDFDAAVRTISVQAALLAAGGLDPKVVRHLRGRPGVIDRYVLLEVCRATAALQGVLPGAVVASVRSVWAGEIPASAEDSLQRAGGRERLPKPPAWFGTILPRRLLAGLALVEGATGPNPEQNEEHGRLNLEHVEHQQDEEDEEEEGSEQELKLFRLASAAMAINNPVTMILKKVFGAGRKSAGTKGGAEVPIGSAQAVASLGGDARLGRHIEGTRGLPPPNSSGVAMYPEWDVFRRGYRWNFCQVVEYDTEPASSDPVPPPDGVHLLRRRLARISRSLERHRRQEYGDQLDLDALVEMAVSAAAGCPVDARVYEVRRRTAPNLAVALVLDASGSTGEGRADGSRVYDEQRRVLANLASALEDLGYRVTVYAFHSNGEKHVRMIRIKTFDDRFDQAARARLGALQPAGFTRMGTAIRHAVALLADGGGIQRQLMVMLSDGFPYDHGGYEGRYAEEDTRKALVEAQARGVACACLNFAPPEEDNRLERIFGGSAHLRVGDLNPELPVQIASLFTGALKTIAIESGGGARRSASA